MADESRAVAVKEPRPVPNALKESAAPKKADKKPATKAAKPKDSQAKKPPSKRPSKPKGKSK